MLTYRIRKAISEQENNPALFLLHGYGSNADDLFSFTPYLPETQTIIALQAPLTIANGSFAWYPLYPKPDGTFDSDLETAWKTVELLMENIEELIEKYALNSKDISLLGFSQGAILSWALAFSKPNKIRRIVALSGVVHESVDTSKSPTFLAYAAHGTEDMVIPIDKARNTILPLVKKYQEIDYHEFSDGHGVSQENFNLLLQWLNKTAL